MKLFRKYKTQNLNLKKFLYYCNTAILITSAAPEAQSASLHSLDDRKVVKAEVSRQGLTRITVKEDRILNVFGVTGEYVLETDEDQGQIFIRPMGPGSLNPISLTLTTEKGRTQDLLLTPGDKTPEALILQAEESSTQQKAFSTLPSRGDIEDLIVACQENRIPVGYKLMPLDLKALNHKHHLIREMSNDHLRGLTYEIKNAEQNPLSIKEEEFATDPQTIAVLTTKRTLNPGERTLVYVIAKAHP